MTGAAVRWADWIGDLEQAFAEVATSALGCAAVVPAGRAAAAPAGLQGAYLGLVGPAGAIQVGVAGDEGTCQALAAGLLMLEPGAEPLPAGEMADAMSEIVNIVAGGFKARVRDRASPLQLGLPVFFRGAPQVTDHTAIAAAEVDLGGRRATLVLIHPRGGEA